MGPNQVEHLYTMLPEYQQVKQQGGRGGSMGPNQVEHLYTMLPGYPQVNTIFSKAGSEVLLNF